MCAILGLIGNIDQNKFKNMLDIMSNRGYDKNGYYFDNDIMLGHKVEPFDKWLEMNNKKYPDDDLALRELAINFLQLYDYMGMLRNAWEIVYDTEQSKGKEITIKETYEEKVNKVKSFKSKDYIKEYVLAKELRLFSKGFIAFMEDNGISEVMINALNDEELEEWLQAYKRIKRDDIKLMKVLTDSIS